MKRTLLAALLALVVLLPVAPSVAQTQPPASYTKNFDNYSVSDPVPFAPDSTLDVLVHSRDTSTWRSLEPMAAEHGAHCEAPPATHALTGSYDDSVFLCAANPHLMTGINATGYGVIYLTPAALADFSGGEAVIRWDMSTHRSSTRDWIDAWVTPYDDLMAVPLDDWLPDLQGPPRRGLHARLDTSGGSMFHVERIDDYAATDLGSRWWVNYESALTPSASRRDTFELRVSRTHVKLWMPAYNVVWIDDDMADLGWDQGVVQLGHHSYNPVKDCPSGQTCTPNTWHWDNLSISPSLPLTLTPAANRWANPSSPAYTFAQGAGPETTLQVAALADTLDASLDGGTTWMPMAHRNKPVFHWGGRSSFALDLPEGTTGVMLRGTEQTGSWDANHATLMSKRPRTAPPTPTALPTNTPVPTATPVPATNTPGPTSTPVPIPTSTPTPVPATSTPLPPTATAIPTTAPLVSCQVVVILNGTPGPLRECR